jgi:hypothetical protein
MRRLHATLQTKELYGYAIKGMDNYLPFQKVFFFKRSIPSAISIANRRLLILDGHGSHVTLEAIQQAQEFGLDMITLLRIHLMHFNPWMWFV